MKMKRKNCNTKGGKYRRRTLIRVNRSIMDFQVFVKLRICIKYSEYARRRYVVPVSRREFLYVDKINCGRK